MLNEAFICCSPACSRALEFKFHRRDPLLLRETCSWRDDRQLKPPGKGAERREERRAAVADLTEARISNGGNTAVAARGRKMEEEAQKAEEEEGEAWAGLLRAEGKKRNKRKKEKRAGFGPVRKGKKEKEK